MENIYFEITACRHSMDATNLIKIINQGIDARLTGFTKSVFSLINDRITCKFHIDELEIVIRRLLELDTEESELLANDIVYLHYGIETI